MIQYDLTGEAWGEVLRVAALRHKGKENLASTRQYTSYNPNIVGCAGEMAFELATGLEMDRRQLPGGDGGYDFVLPAGTHLSLAETTVDVKTRTLRTRIRGGVYFWLKAKDLTKRCDLFVFAIQQKKEEGGVTKLLPDVALVGFIAQADVESVATVRRNHYQELEYVVSLKDVQPIEALLTVDADNNITWTQGG